MRVPFWEISLGDTENPPSGASPGWDGPGPFTTSGFLLVHSERAAAGQHRLGMSKTPEQWPAVGLRYTQASPTNVRETRDGGAQTGPQALARHEPANWDPKRER